jgi:hypothetical protein
LKSAEPDAGNGLRVRSILIDAFSVLAHLLASEYVAVAVGQLAENEDSAFEEVAYIAGASALSDSILKSLGFGRNKQYANNPTMLAELSAKELTMICLACVQLNSYSFSRYDETRHDRSSRHIDRAVELVKAAHPALCVPGIGYRPSISSPDPKSTTHDTLLA